MPRNPKCIPLSKFMVAFLRKLSETLSQQTVDNVFNTLVHLRDEVPYLLNNPPMAERFNDLRWLTNHADIEARISARSKTTQSGYTFYKNICTALRVDGSPDLEASLAHYREKCVKMQKKIGEELSIHEDESLIAWDDIIKHRDGLEDKSSMTYLMLCLYTMIPPLRNDFVEMDIVFQESDASREDWNYYCVPTRTMHLNAFKNVGEVGTKRIVVPEELHEVIGRVRLAMHRKTLDNKHGIPMLVGDRGARLNACSVSKLLTKSFGRPLGSTQLRRSFVSRNSETLIAAQANAEAMCHSIYTAIKYYAKTKCSSE